MGVELDDAVTDDESLATPSQSFTLLLQGELSPETYPLWLVDECHRARRSEYRRRLRRRRTQGPSGPLANWLVGVKALRNACVMAAHQPHYDPTLGFAVSPAIAVIRSFG